MKYPENEDYEFRLNDWFWYTLGFWKQGLILMIACAILVTCAFYVRYRRNSTGAAATEQVTEEDSRTEELKEMRDQYKSIEQAYQNSLAAAKDSYLMDLDPYNVTTRIIQYYVTLKEPGSDDFQESNQLSAIKASYVTAISSDEISQQIAKSTKVNAEDVSYLIRTDTSNTTSMYESGNLKIYITADSAATCDIFERCLDRAIKNASEDVNQIAPHTISKIGSVDSSGFSQTVLDSQQSVLNNLANYQNMRKSILTSGDLSDAELNYVSGATDTLDEAAETDTTETVGVAEPFSAKKYAALGALAGFCLMLLWSFLRYSNGRMLVHPYYAEDRYGIDTDLIRTSQKKIGKLNRMRYRGVKIHDTDTVIRTIENKIQQQNIKAIAVLSGTATENVKSFTEKLTASLGKKSVSVLFVEKPADHPEQSFGIMKDRLPVVIAEQVPGISRLDTDQVISFVNENDLTILDYSVLI